MFSIKTLKGYQKKTKKKIVSLVCNKYDVKLSRVIFIFRDPGVSRRFLSRVYGQNDGAR